jgi:hypothetical protein
MQRRLVLVGTVVLVLLLVIGRGIRPVRSVFSPPPPRACATPLRYQKDSNGTPLSFTGAKLLYHWTVDQLVEERMNLYDGTVTLACGESWEEQLVKYVSPDVVIGKKGIVPAGTILAKVASGLQLFEGKSVSYADFPKILAEHWREYDCYLQNASQDDRTIRKERVAASLAYDHLLSVLSNSERFLPAHVGLTCLIRTALDTRNALGLYSDVSACVPARLSLPRTSLR